MFVLNLYENINQTVNQTISIMSNIDIKRYILTVIAIQTSAFCHRNKGSYVYPDYNDGTIGITF